MDGRRRTGPALEAMYRFMLWLVPTVEKFPRSQKLFLGDRIQSTRSWPAWKPSCYGWSAGL